MTKHKYPQFITKKYNRNLFWKQKKGKDDQLSEQHTINLKQKRLPFITHTIQNLYD